MAGTARHGIDSTLVSPLTLTISIKHIEFTILRNRRGDEVMGELLLLLIHTVDKLETYTLGHIFVARYRLRFALGAIQHKVSIHSTILAGALLCPVAIIATAFVPNVAWMSVTLGLLYGAGYGALFIGTAVYIVSYFHEYRGFAMGIKFLGVSLSGIAGPSLVSLLVSEHGLKGCFLIMGGMMLHLIPLAFMLRYANPVTCKLCRRRKSPGQTVNGVSTMFYGTTMQIQATNGSTCSMKQPDFIGAPTLEACDDLERRNSLTISGTKSTIGFATKHSMCPSAPQEHRTAPLGFLREAIDVLRSPCFYVLLVAMVAADFTLPLFGSTIVDYAVDKGVAFNAAAQLVVYQCLGGFAGRLVLPLITDKLAHSRCPITAISLAALSLCFLVFPHIRNLAAVAAVSFLTGVQQGYLNAFKSVLVAEYLGVHSVAVSWGFIGLATLPLVFCEPSIVGVSYGGLVVGTAMYMVSHFEEYRGFAMGIKFLGVSFSGIVGPSLLSYLSTEHGLYGCLLITGGMMLHLIALALMLRYAKPVRWIRCKHPKASTQAVEGVATTFYGTTTRITDWNGGRYTAKWPDSIQDSVLKTPSGPEGRHSFSLAVANYAVDNAPKLSTYASTPHKHSSVPLGFLHQATEVLRSPCFYVLLVAMVAGDFTLPFFSSSIVDYAADKGVALVAATQLVMYQCLGGIFGRLVIPLITDKLAHSRCPITAFSLAALSMCFFVFPHITNFTAVAALCSLTGVQQGYLNAVKSVLVAEYLGVHSVAVSWGFMGVATLPLVLSEPSIVGNVLFQY
ncbi:hypothetical protein HPB50_024178 [Hyalomma asiaticum]|uniref:Uncharacterized protein n=1 Tax=Hyalomma asiaticum TaxID=266040 RepID=A0ACB7SI77_HYAAI|nr:hypothetical protein HPB50_024178 [Hyalomma asiaticum]